MAPVTQMHSIAANPIYHAVAPTHQFSNGAPVVIGEHSIPPQQIGKSEVTVNGAGKIMPPLRYAAIEASALLPSNELNGNPDKRYTSGEPGQLRALAGNGRVAGLKGAWAKGTAAQYKKDMIADAERHGIDAKVIAGMKQPVLVRLIKPEDVTPEMGDDSNVSGIAAMSSLDQAKSDSRRVDFAKLEFDDKGAPTESALHSFIAAMPQSEQAGLLTRRGEATIAAEQRLIGAIYAKAYDDPELIELYTSARDPDAKVLLNVTGMVAPAVSEVSGELGKKMKEAIVESLQAAINASRKGFKLKDVIGQRDMGMGEDSPRLAAIMAENVRRPNVLASVISEAARWAESNKGGSDMFGAKEPPDMAAVIGRIQESLAQRKQPKADEAAEPQRILTARPLSTNPVGRFVDFVEAAMSAIDTGADIEAAKRWATERMAAPATAAN